MGRLFFVSINDDKKDQRKGWRTELKIVKVKVQNKSYKTMASN